MAHTSASSGVVGLLFAVLAAARTSEAACTWMELGAVFNCIVPHSLQFLEAIGSSDTCNRALITPQICRLFGEIATCIKGKQLSAETCLPHFATQINPQLVIPCKLEDFTAGCPDVDPFWMTTTTTTTTGSNGATTTTTGSNGATTTTTGSNSATTGSNGATTTTTGSNGATTTTTTGSNGATTTTTSNGATTGSNGATTTTTTESNGATTTTTTTGSNGATSATQFPWITSLMTTLLVVVMAAESG